MKFAIGASVVALALVGAADAADLHVPAQYPTIQAAVNAAVTGDVVLVAPGTYNEQVTIDGKAITVRSTGTASNTKIDRVNAAGDVFTIRNIATGAVTIQGITVLRTASDAVDVENSTLNLSNFRVLNSSRAVMIGTGAQVQANDLQCLFLYGGTGAGCFLSTATSSLNLIDGSFQGIGGGDGNCVVVVDNADATLQDVLFANNSGGNGCVRVDGVGTLNAANCRWQLGNYSAGSVVFISGAGEVAISNSQFVSLTGRCVHSESGQVVLQNIEHSSHQGLDAGSLAYANSGALSVTNATSINCQGRVGANTGGGWIQVRTAGLVMDTCVVTGFTTRQPDYVGTFQRAFGGVVGVLDAGPTVEIRNCEFRQHGLSGPGSAYPFNATELRGRSVALRSRQALLEGCSFQGGPRDVNLCCGGQYNYFYVLSEVYGEGSLLTLDNCAFDLSAGGRMSVLLDFAGSALIQNSGFKSASYDHPTIAAASTGSLLVENSSFESCHRAIERSGTGMATVSGSRFVNNYGGGGSAISSLATALTVSECFFKGNGQPSIYLGDGQNYVLLSNSSFCGSPESEIYRYMIEKGENYFNVDCTDDCDLDGLPDSYELNTGLATDCNGNGIPDNCDADSGGSDCNANGIPDSCDIAGGAADCNANGIPDSCESDCDGDGVPNACEIASGAPDCDANGVPDACQADCDDDGLIDVCEIATGSADCNANGIPDSCEIASGASTDFNKDGVIDACQPDMQFAGLELEIVPITNRGLDDLFPSTAVCYRLYAKTTQSASAVLGLFGNASFPMSITATGGFWQSPSGGDLASEVPCDLSGVLPSARFDSWLTIGLPCASGNAAQNTGLDLSAFNKGGGINDNDGIVFVQPGVAQSIAGDAKRVLLAQLTTNEAVLPSGLIDVVGRASNGVGDWIAYGQSIPTPALVDCNGNGQQDAFDIALGTALDCDQSGVPDSCEYGSATTDCNMNGISDLCDVVSAFSSDLNGNFVPDECECSGDVDGNGRVDVDDIIDVITSWGDTGNSLADVNNDNVVDAADLVIVLAGYGSCL
jgi:hypothetical protein